MDEKEDWTSCPISLQQCTSDASFAVKRGTEDEECTLNVPVQSIICSHLVCLSCIRKQAALVNYGGNDKNCEETVQKKGVQCPICYREDVFNADDLLFHM